jgi:hypothetical protein
VLTLEVNGSTGREAHTDDLERLLKTVDGVREIQPVWVDIQALPGSHAEYGCSLGHVGEGEHSLGYEDRVATDRFGHSHPYAHLAGSGGQVAEEYLVVKVLVWGGALGGDPAELLVQMAVGKKFWK